MTTRRPSRAAGNTFSSGCRSALATPSGDGIISGSLHMFMIKSLPTLVVSKMIVFLKSISLPSPSSIIPLSNTWKKIS